MTSSFVCVCVCYRYLFQANAWMALEEDDGKLERLVRLSTKEDIVNDEGLLSNNVSKSLWDDHIWLSVGYRQSRSAFTRVQRLSCCLAILFLTMVTNAMSFGTGDDQTPQSAFQIGPFSVTVHQVYTSVASSLIVVPPLLIITTLFAKSADKPKKNKDGKVVDETSAADMVTKRKKVPYWGIYIAYALVALAVTVSAFFTILYAFQWGRKKSTQWLTTFLLGFFQSVFILQPIKVSGATSRSVWILMALMLICLCGYSSAVGPYTKLSN